ncbi:MAG TPA: response regulator [Thermoanaerobaculia bacterium]|nr:response regulator [Thermoanaerobaculia bacterium]
MASRIVVIDDAPEVVETISYALATAGHAVVPVANDSRAESRIGEERPDLVLLDIVMPERNGFEILRGLRRREDTRACRVVVVSRKSEPSDQQWARMQGANDFLAKPFTSEQLLAVVRRNLL